MKLGRLHRRSSGFTLLEVLVAVAILGLSLTAIMSAQYSAVVGVSHARNMSAAVGLVRCKMSELEQLLREEGFQENEISDDGPCCEGDSSDVSCEWRIEKPLFPEAELGELNLNTELEGLGNLLPGNDSKTPSPAGTSAVADALSGQGDLAAMAAGGVGGIASMVMSMVYPDLRRLLEASTRRISVTVRWQQGKRSYDFKVVQWVARPQQPPPEVDEEGDVAPTGGAASPAAGSGR
jgi:general secretion pathway protein I